MPTQVVPIALALVMLGGGGGHGHVAGPAVGWGLNDGGQLDFPAGTFTAIAAGYMHGVALRANGKLVAWGKNVLGQTDVPAGTFTAISAGYEPSLALRGPRPNKRRLLQ